jgi:hypothetical protein
MKLLPTIVLTCALLCGAHAAEMPKMPPPAKEHAWLEQFVGEWDAKVEIFMEPGKPPMQASSTERFRSLGGFWVVGEGKSEMVGHPFSSVLTLGYSPEKKRYVGTWVDSMGSYLWSYEGTLDETGKILTLETEGPCPMQGGKMSQFKEVTEFKSPDLRVFTSAMKGDDGKWNTMVRVESRRKK